MPKKETNEEVNFMQVGDSHCFGCHQTFPPSFRTKPHILDCPEKVKLTPCKEWNGKTCEFSQPKKEICPHCVAGVWNTETMELCSACKGIGLIADVSKKVTEESWEERFERQKGGFTVYNTQAGSRFLNEEQLKYFLRSEITKAYDQGCRDAIKSNESIREAESARIRGIVEKIIQEEKDDKPEDDLEETSEWYKIQGLKQVLLALNQNQDEKETEN